MLREANTNFIYIFFISLQLTYADIMFFDLMNIFAKGEPTVPQLEKLPLLAAHYQRVLNVPRIKAWVEKRPKTEH